MASQGGPRVPKGYPRRLFWRVRGEYLRWFPPYMRKAPLAAGAGAVLDPTARFGHMRKLKTVI